MIENAKIPVDGYCDVPVPAECSGMDDIPPFQKEVNGIPSNVT